MENAKSLKYQNDITELENCGIELPELNNPLNLDAFRFAFQTNHINNHKPVYKIDPNRAIQSPLNRKVSTSGYALSCFNTELNAKSKFKSICKNIKLFPKTAGDSLYYGNLMKDDGLVTEIEINGHFDFYEYSDFDPNKRFIFKEKLQ